MANKNITAMVLAAAAASVNGDDIDNISGNAAHVVIDITAISGTTPTATFTVEGKDTLSGKYYTLLASAALNATGTTVLKIGAGLTAAANSVANDILPDVIRVTCAITGTGPSVTAKVGVILNG